MRVFEQSARTGSKDVSPLRGLKQLGEDFIWLRTQDLRPGLVYFAPTGLGDVRIGGPVRTPRVGLAVRSLVAEWRKCLVCDGKGWQPKGLPAGRLPLRMQNRWRAWADTARWAEARSAPTKTFAAAGAHPDRPGWVRAI